MTADPYAAVTAPPRFFLHRLNPLSKLAAPLPFMAVLLVAREVWTPLLFLVFAIVTILIGARLTPRQAVLLVVGLPALVLVLSFSFGLWTDASLVDTTPLVFQVGEYRFFLGAWLIGLATALRLGAVLALALIPGLTTTGPELVRASVQHLRVPYRVGYTALAAYRFVPRFRHDLDLIRQAHRVRGVAGGRGPIAGIRRAFGYVVPLLAGAIRHAERVSFAMDSRAFGAYPTRTERHLLPLRPRDAVFVGVFWLVGAGLLMLAARLN
ncbi:energy-coupling factor transporter transmembrane component T [Mycetocola sp. 2940]|uniref:energy-coupling factor transporter transmembrane component T family protein n=1 Tax=Mycetocola sp. 2940 TaxID=3156452 RepID=UPI0033995EB6